MKKCPCPHLKFVLSALLLSFNIFMIAAQSKTIDASKNHSNEMVISIPGIEYDNPDFSLLKENLKTNQKVKSISPSYAQQTAKISFTYSGTAAELWDELPGNIKQFFKLTTMENSRITLTIKTVVKDTTATNNTSAATSMNDADCNCCTYFPLCKYDNTRSFQGIVYKGITFDNGMYYYYCNNGVLTQKQVTLNGTEVTSVYTQTILKCNAPAGTTWSETDEKGSTNQHTIVSKGITLQVNGNIYKDVMVVYHKVYSQSAVTTSQNNYYSNGIGLIKDEPADANYDPAKAITEKKTADSILSALPGSIDETIAGTWAYYDSVMKWSIFYKFKADGSWEYYVGSISPGNQMFTFSKCYWHVNGGNLELWCSGWKPQHITFALQKKNDQATGKPTLIIQFKGTENRIYFSQDGKAPWN
jgi:hypothetical protein